MPKTWAARRKEYEKLVDNVYGDMDVSWMDEMIINNIDDEEVDKTGVETRKHETMEAIAAELKLSNEQTASEIKEMMLEISRLRVAMGLRDDTTASSDSEHSEHEITFLNTAQINDKETQDKLGEINKAIGGNKDKLSGVGQGSY